MSVRRCSICRRPGHNAHTCPDRDEPPPLVAISDESGSENEEENYAEEAAAPSSNPLNVPADPSRLYPEIIDLDNSFDVVDLLCCFVWTRPERGTCNRGLLVTVVGCLARVGSSLAIIHSDGQ